MIAPDILDYYRSWLAYRRWFLRVPGVQACVLGPDGPQLSVAIGLADELEGAALTEHHLFRVASHSKTFTAVAILQLVARGQLRLDDTVAERLPELAGSPVARASLRELLSHGGGVIRDSEDGDFWQLAKPYPDEDELVAIAQAASAAPIARNERFKYSNIAYGLLGLVIERSTGQRFTDAIRQSIVEPLGLTRTGAEPEESQRAELAAGHSALSYARTRSVIEHVDTRALAAATGFYSTASELAAFYAALLPGVPALLDDESQRLLRHRVWEVREGQSSYGLGVFLNKLGNHLLFGHSGGYPGHITRTFADPERRVVVSVLTNAIDGPAEPLADTFFRLLDAAAAAEHAPAGDATRFTGRFSSLWGVADVARLGGRLFLLNPTVVNPVDDPTALEVVDERTLKMVSGPGGGSVGEYMRYEFGPDGQIVSVRATSGMTMRPFQLPSF